MLVNSNLNKENSYHSFVVEARKKCPSSLNKLARNKKFYCDILTPLFPILHIYGYKIDLRQKSKISLYTLQDKNNDNATITQFVNIRKDLETNYGFSIESRNNLADFETIDQIFANYSTFSNLDEVISPLLKDSYNTSKFAKYQSFIHEVAKDFDYRYITDISQILIENRIACMHSATIADDIDESVNARCRTCKNRLYHIKNECHDKCFCPI